MSNTNRFSKPTTICDITKIAEGSNKTTFRILDTLSDWKCWIANIKFIAVTGFNIWDLINPDIAQELLQPITLQASDYSDFNNTTTYIALSPEQREEYKISYQRFKDIQLI
ncbi:hypothetical protein ACMFMF_009188 [Clarireedia jacksonii]